MCYLCPRGPVLPSGNLIVTDLQLCFHSLFKALISPEEALKTTVKNLVCMLCLTF